MAAKLGKTQPRLLGLPLILAVVLAQVAAATSMAPTNNQHVQFTVAMEAVSCSQLPKFNAGGGTKQDFADRFRGMMRQDVSNYLTNNGQLNAVPTISSVGDACKNFKVSSMPAVLVARCCGRHDCCLPAPLDYTTTANRLCM